MRGQFAPRAAVEKDIMKVQNTMRKIQDEFKHLYEMKDSFD